MPYDYPPSRYISKYGPLQKGTHYYCEGIAFFDYRLIKKLRCQFEVAYTQECEVIIVCYFPDLPRAYHNLSNHFETCYKLLGRTLGGDLTVHAERNNEPQFNLSAKEIYLGNISRGVTYTVVFSGSCYKVSSHENRTDHSNSRYFTFDVSNLDFPAQEDRNYDFTKGLFFHFGKDNSFNIKLKLKSRSRSYFNEATGILSVEEVNLPQNYSALEVANVLCALASLGLGRDIQWSSYTSSNNVVREVTWVTKNIRGSSKFHPLIVIESLNPTEWGKLQKFVSNGLQVILDIQLEKRELDFYIKIIRDYVDYCAIRGISNESRIRLIATLVDELLNKWRKFTHKPESRQFREKLKDFFTFYGKNVEQTAMKNRIRAFVDTRNAIAHEGCFAWDAAKPDKKNIVEFSSDVNLRTLYEYENALMMIPIMIFCIFGFEGNYDDLLYGYVEWL